MKDCEEVLKVGEAFAGANKQQQGWDIEPFTTQVCPCNPIAATTPLLNSFYAPPPPPTGGPSPRFGYATPPPFPALRAHLVTKGQ